MFVPSTFTPPPELAKHVRETCGASGSEWLAKLPVIIRECEENWGINIGAAYQMAEFNFVAPAGGHSSGPAVIKIAPPFDNEEFRTEAAYLRLHNGKGCVALLEEDLERRAILIERAEPGANLADQFSGREMDALKPAIEVLRRVASSPPSSEGEVIVLSHWFDNLRRCIESKFPAAYAERGLAIYERLSADAPLMYLHGDLHPGNIVTATREPYLLIDPKGIIGPMGYEIAVFLNNFHWWQEHRADVRGRLAFAVEQFSDAFGIPEVDLREWAFAQMVLSAWWTFDEMPNLYDNDVAKADIWDV
jgi:streptomycin 6-kinase